jgi:hypothetical protein
MYKSAGSAYFDPLRRTYATALTGVAGKAVARIVLGYAAEDVTDICVTVPPEDHLDAIHHRAAVIEAGSSEHVVPLGAAGPRAIESGRPESR